MDRPQVLALNKCDALDEETLKERLKDLEQASASKVIPISGVSGQNVDQVIQLLAETIGKEKTLEAENEAAEDNEGNPSGWVPL